LPEKAVEMPVTVSEPQVKPVSPVEEEITPVVVTVTPAVTKPPEILTTQPTTTLTAPTPVKAQPAEVEAEHGITPIEFLATGSTQIIIFMLRGDYYGIDISNVHTIIKPQPACPVPHTADFLIGLINLRGQVVPVADLRKRLCFPAMESNKDTRVVIVSVRDELAGILVDAVVGVKTLPNDTIEPPSMIFTTTDINLLNGIAKSEGKLILLLDVVKVFIRKQMEMHSTDLVFS
jgi:purine-binding chemotaxis protein CheW